MWESYRDNDVSCGRRNETYPPEKGQALKARTADREIDGRPTYPRDEVNAGKMQGFHKFVNPENPLYAVGTCGPRLSRTRGMMSRFQGDTTVSKPMPQKGLFNLCSSLQSACRNAHPSAIKTFVSNALSFGALNT